MPRIIAKVEGRGNGIKTALVNIVELAQSLNRESPEITKFFGCELGSQTTYTAGNTPSDHRAIVNGSHTPQTLQTHLSKYIENFVLCANCKLPETHYKIKSGIITQKCAACGHKSPVDMTHKLTTFIVAQHKKAKEASGGKSDKKEKKKEKKDKDEDSGEDAVKEKKVKKEKKTKSTSPAPDAEENLDEDEEVKAECKVKPSTSSKDTDNEDILVSTVTSAVEDLDLETDKTAVGKILFYLLPCFTLPICDNTLSLESLHSLLLSFA
jgi:translation initiation factor 5